MTFRKHHSSPEAGDEPIEIRRKRLIHRSLYTGMKETDLLLGAFARASVGAFASRQPDLYESLLGVPDPAFYAWAIGIEVVPPEHDNDVMTLLRDFTRQHRP